MDWFVCQDFGFCQDFVSMEGRILILKSASASTSQKIVCPFWSLNSSQGCPAWSKSLFKSWCSKDKQVLIKKPPNWKGQMPHCILGRERHSLWTWTCSCQTAKDSEFHYGTGLLWHESKPFFDTCILTWSLELIKRDAS